jgi:hypothetical protein
MALFAKPFRTYFSETRVGLWLLLAIGVLRFLLKPVFGIPYPQATWYSSLTILALILLVVYSVLAASRRETYRDVLGIAAAISLSNEAIIVAAIAIDEFGGVDTYYTDLAHGGNLDPFLHMGGHLIGAVFGTLVGWGLGSLVFAIARAVGKPTAPSVGPVSR